MESLKELIGQFGFPIFIAVYLLWERKNVAGLLIGRMDELMALLKHHTALHPPHRTKRTRDQKRRKTSEHNYVRHRARATALTQRLSRNPK